MTDNFAVDCSHITTVIFDMDGTLIKHTWRLSQLTETLFARFADKLAPVTPAEFFECFWPRNEDMWYMMVDGVLDGDTAARYSYINTLRALKKDVTLAEAMVNCWNELVLEEALPFKDTLAVLAAVRARYRVGILTNGFTTLQRGKISRHRLDEQVDFTLVSEEAGYHKPDKRLFWAALKLAGDVAPEQVLYVGDNLIADIRGAQEAGLTPVFINPDGDSPEGVITIRRLGDLLALLKL
ncbi:MAG: HAD family hydrolase [Chloroflexi bacterium]|nr:HAD family hydrolase [Chloroflexota bacterium]